MNQSQLAAIGAETIKALDQICGPTAYDGKDQCEVCVLQEVCKLRQATAKEE